MSCSLYRGKIVTDKGPLAEAVDELISPGHGHLGTPFEELFNKLVEVYQGKATVAMLSPDAEGVQSIFINSSSGNGIWVRISSDGQFEMGYPGA